MNKTNKKLAKKAKNKIMKLKTDEKIAKLKNNLNIENVVSTKKLKIILIVIIFLLFCLIGRLFYLQIIDGTYLSSLAISQQTSSSEISSKRGNIYDSTGRSLAISETVDTISVNPSKIKGETDEETIQLKEKIASAFSEIFELDYNETLEKINGTNSSKSVEIVQKVEEDKVNVLKSWMKENKISSGINIDEDTKRYYPNGNLASQVIGFCGKDNQGLSGIEFSYNSILEGTSGEIVTSTDASQSEIPNSQQSFIAAENGYDLSLTIDVKIQSIKRSC